jgi:hypothetical protein
MSPNDQSRQRNAENRHALDHARSFTFANHQAPNWLIVDHAIRSTRQVLTERGNGCHCGRERMRR